MDDQEFQDKVDALLTMPDGWDISIIRQKLDDGTWYCTISGPRGAMEFSGHCPSSASAIKRAKEKAHARSI